MKRKYLAIIAGLLACLCLAVTGCGAEGGESTAVTQGSSSEEEMQAQSETEETEEPKQRQKTLSIGRCGTAIV